MSVTGPALPGDRSAGTKLKPPRLRAFRIIAALILREMGSTYGRNPGGYLWAIISPAGAIVMLAVAFSFMVRTPSLGTSFILFYATGYLPFNLYSDLAQKIAAALRFTRALLAYPGVSWVHAVIARLLLNTLTQTMVFCVVITGFMSVIDSRTIIQPGFIVTAMLLGATSGLAIGLMNCLLVGLFPVWDRVWKIMSRPLFLASGVFFIYEDMPKLAQSILWYNPLLHMTGQMRRGFYPTYYADYINLTYAFGLPLLIIAFSVLFLRRFYRRVLEK